MLKGGFVAANGADGSKGGFESCGRAIQMLASTDVESALHHGSRWGPSAGGRGLGRSPVQRPAWSAKERVSLRRPLRDHARG